MASDTITAADLIFERILENGWNRNNLIRLREQLDAELDAIETESREIARQIRNTPCFE